MLELGLSEDEARAYEDALHSDHNIRIEVRILDSNEEPVGNASYPQNRVLGGSVNVDATAEVTRQLDLSILDPERRLPFIPKNAAQGGLFAENFVHVRYCVEVEELDMWVEVPVFHGPLSLYEHSGSTVRIEGLGKESLGMAPHVLVDGFTVPKGTELDAAIKKVMRRTGEQRFNVPEMRGEGHLTKDYVVKPGQEAWRVVVGGEDQVTTGNQGKIEPLVRQTKNDHYAFYDGRGRLTVRRRRRPTVWRASEDYLTAKPTVSYDIYRFRNYVKILGAEGKGDKKQVIGIATLPREHPLSPTALSRNGVPRYMAVIQSAPSLKSKDEADAKAKDVLDGRQQAGIDVQFECLPVPHLEEWDPISVETEDGDIDYVIKQFTIPLTSSETMSVGFNKSVRQYRKGTGKQRERNRRARKRRQRRRRRRKHRHEKNKKEDQ